MLFFNFFKNYIELNKETKLERQHILVNKIEENITILKKIYNIKYENSHNKKILINDKKAISKIFLEFELHFHLLHRFTFQTPIIHI